jgi:hypothetical protein
MTEKLLKMLEEQLELIEELKKHLETNGETGSDGQ